MAAEVDLLAVAMVLTMSALRFHRNIFAQGMRDIGDTRANQQPGRMGAIHKDYGHCRFIGSESSRIISPVSSDKAGNGNVGKEDRRTPQQRHLLEYAKNQRTKKVTLPVTVTHHLPERTIAKTAASRKTILVSRQCMTIGL